MAKLQVAPTKSKFLELRKNLGFAIDGHDLLEQKRTILTIELMGHLDHVRQMERDLVPLMSQAFAALRDASLELGAEALARLSFAAVVGHQVSVSTRPVMGLRLPTLESQFRDVLPRVSPLGSSARVDEATRRFVEALKFVTRLAELQNQVVRLARELKKTQRRVNALEKLFIPSYRETIKYIAESLEERERESLVVTKMIKARQAAAAARGPGGSQAWQPSP